MKRLALWQKLFCYFCIAVLAWSLLPSRAFAQRTTSASQANLQPYLDRAIEKVTEFTLDNGLKFIVLERHEAPVISFATYADVGGVDEPDGQTGVAHFLEHLAFKGTSRIGTRDYKTEKSLLDRLDELVAEKKAAIAGDRTEEAKKLEAEFLEVQKQADDLSIKNQFGQIVEQAGGQGLNAATSIDFTVYSYSLPANKLELWMSLESERFLDPVFREFFKEQDVILEERRWRTDNSPIGQLVEAFQDAAFTVHPYKRPIIGYNKDIRNLTPEDVRKFFDIYYVPNNITVAIVGDVYPDRVRELAQTYFSRYSAKPTPPEVNLVEPPQRETREVSLKLKSEPIYLEGFHRPSLNHPDSAVYDAIVAILSNGRTSRLYKSLVEEQQIALSASGFTGFPGDKYPNLMVLYATTAPGHTLEEVEAALDREIERLKTEPVTLEELERVKTQARADVLYTLDSNQGMAYYLVEYQAKTGTWRNLFEQLNKIGAVTAEDILRVAKATFTSENKTIGRLLTDEE
ncbi:MULTISPECIES: pitrilysin family protein [Spirulina sp. CCY15215]|uniref:M16 family metallopeptidase n=1 Tax=Spirulina sp. CCY15215 TaxID=2767591 RepID=UPI00194E9A53|nr:pitrilysin family protein [Spirulina major]